MMLCLTRCQKMKQCVRKSLPPSQHKFASGGQMMQLVVKHCQHLLTRRSRITLQFFAATSTTLCGPLAIKPYLLQCDQVGKNSPMDTLCEVTLTGSCCEHTRCGASVTLITLL